MVVNIIIHIAFIDDIIAIMDRKETLKTFLYNEYCLTFIDSAPVFSSDELGQNGDLSNAMYYLIKMEDFDEDDVENIVECITALLPSRDGLGYITLTKIKPYCDCDTCNEKVEYLFKAWKQSKCKEKTCKNLCDEFELDIQFDSKFME